METYSQTIMQPIMNDLFKYTWLTERYNCQGEIIRAPYYHEYPEMLCVLLHDVSYGIQIGFNRITISPFVYSGKGSYLVQ